MGTPELELLRDGADDASTIVLAHGAGQGMRSPFMATLAAGLAAAGLHVVRFEFDYMRTAAAAGKRRAPDREPALLACWRRVVTLLAADGHPPAHLFIGGKSMGGRMASLVADELGVAGLVCLGYPFHPPGKPERTRTAHLASLRTPALICQGERDPFGRRDEVAGYALAAGIELCWLPDGDHGFRPRRASGTDEAANIALAVEAVGRFVAGCTGHGDGAGDRSPGPHAR